MIFGRYVPESAWSVMRERKHSFFVFFEINIYVVSAKTWSILFPISRKTAVGKFLVAMCTFIHFIDESFFENPAPLGRRETIRVK